MKNTLLNKSKEALSELDLYEDIILSLKNKLCESHNSKDLVIKLNNCIETSNELRADILNIISIVEEDKLTINDMPDTIKKLNFVIKEAKNQITMLYNIF